MNDPNRRLIKSAIALVVWVSCRAAPGPHEPSPAQEATGGHQNRSPAKPSVPASVDYARHVAPIVNAHCVGCHQPGAIAPFPLTSYDEVYTRAELIAEVTKEKYMPPWLPEAEPNEFIGQRGLTPVEIETLGKWFEQGAKRGDPSQEPKYAPRDSNAWQLGNPDLVVKFPEYRLKAEGLDVFRNLVASIELPELRYVKAWEFRPGNRAVVHHARIAVDTTTQSLELDRLDPKPGFAGMLMGGAKSPDGHFLGWTPGKRARELGVGMSFSLRPGSSAVVQLHLLPSGKVERVAPEIALYFTDHPPGRVPVVMRLGSMLIDIPAGEPSYE